MFGFTPVTNTFLVILAKRMILKKISAYAEMGWGDTPVVTYKFIHSGFRTHDHINMLKYLEYQNSA